MEPELFDQTTRSGSDPKKLQKLNRDLSKQNLELSKWADSLKKERDATLSDKHKLKTDIRALEREHKKACASIESSRAEIQRLRHKLGRKGPSIDLTEVDPPAGYHEEVERLEQELAEKNREMAALKRMMELQTERQTRFQMVLSAEVNATKLDEEPSGRGESQRSKVMVEQLLHEQEVNSRLRRENTDLKMRMTGLESDLESSMNSPETKPRKRSGGSFFRRSRRASTNSSKDEEKVTQSEHKRSDSSELLSDNVEHKPPVSPSTSPWHSPGLKAKSRSAADLQTLQSCLQLAIEEKKTAEIHSSKLAEQLDEARTEIRELQGTASKAEKYSREEGDRGQALQSALLAASEEKRVLNEEVEEMEQLLEAEYRKYVALEAQFSKVRAKSNAATTQLESDITQLQKELDEAKAAMVSPTPAELKLLRVVSDKNMKMKELTEEIERLRRELKPPLIPTKSPKRKSSKTPKSPDREISPGPRSPGLRSPERRPSDPSFPESSIGTRERKLSVGSTDARHRIPEKIVEKATKLLRRASSTDLGEEIDKEPDQLHSRSTVPVTGKSTATSSSDTVAASVKTTASVKVTAIVKATAITAEVPPSGKVVTAAVTAEDEVSVNKPAVTGAPVAATKAGSVASKVAKARAMFEGKIDETKSKPEAKRPASKRWSWVKETVLQASEIDQDDVVAKGATTHDRHDASRRTRSVDEKAPVTETGSHTKLGKTVSQPVTSSNPPSPSRRPDTLVNGHQTPPASVSTPTVGSKVSVRSVKSSEGPASPLALRTSVRKETKEILVESPKMRRKTFNESTTSTASPQTSFTRSVALTKSPIHAAQSKTGPTPNGKVLPLHSVTSPPSGRPKSAVTRTSSSTATSNSITLVPQQSQTSESSLGVHRTPTTPSPSTARRATPTKAHSFGYLPQVTVHPSLASTTAVGSSPSRQSQPQLSNARIHPIIATQSSMPAGLAVPGSGEEAKRASSLCDIPESVSSESRGDTGGHSPVVLRSNRRGNRDRPTSLCRSETANLVNLISKMQSEERSGGAGQLRSGQRSRGSASVALNSAGRSQQRPSSYYGGQPDR